MRCSLPQVLNKTWPHRDHTLVNLGIPGNSFQQMAEGECMEGYLPKQVGAARWKQGKTLPEATDTDSVLSQ